MAYSKKETYEKDITAEIQSNYESILGSLGEDVDREGLLKTPERASKAMQFLTQGYQMDAKKIIEQALFMRIIQKWW